MSFSKQTGIIPKNLTKYFPKISILFAELLLLPLVILCCQIYNENYPAIDEYISRSLAEKQTPVGDVFFKAIYQISGVEVTAIIVAVTLAILIWKRYWHEVAVLAVATLGILILVDRILKPFFDRRRPSLPSLVDDLGWDSFPSGHGAGSLVFYYYLAFIIALRHPQIRCYIFSLATIAIALIGFSSIYVQAHWFTDILAGYGFGYIWLLICLGLLKFLNRQDKNRFKMNRS